MFEFILVVLGIIVVVGIAFSKHNAKKPDGPHATKPSDETIHQSYQRVDSLFVNRSELAFFHALNNKLPAHYFLQTKVRMEDIVGVSITIVDRKQRYGLRGRVKSRHVDFCVMDDKGTPHVVIELDGKSHDAQSAKNADILKDGIFQASDIDFMRVKKGEDFHAWAHIIVEKLPKQAFVVPRRSANMYKAPA